tara:strand:- start:1306 stop:2088 length:783 start_codon:yes stop_codon:yes gene_type:complete
MKIISWNVNSIRARKEQLVKILMDENPDFVCLQETKILNEIFPIDEIKKLGYRSYVNGMAAYNGVAILSKYEAEEVNTHDFCKKKDSRHINIKFKNLNIHSIYVPAGGDLADISLNEKFKHKLEFLREMKSYFNFEETKINILCGDLNVAPYEDDVWSHKQLRNVVSHTQMERESLINILETGNFIDGIRKFISPPKNIFTWWSYRSKDFRVNNRGRRLDHIWVTDSRKINLKDAHIFVNKRELNKPSDHVPISLKFDYS